MADMDDMFGDMGEGENGGIPVTIPDAEMAEAEKVETAEVEMAEAKVETEENGTEETGNGEENGKPENGKSELETENGKPENGKSPIVIDDEPIQDGGTIDDEEKNAKPKKPDFIPYISDTDIVQVNNAKM